MVMMVWWWSERRGTREEGWNSGDCGDPQPAVPREEPRVRLQSEVVVLITFVACLLTSGTGELVVNSQPAIHFSTRSLAKRSSALFTSPAHTSSDRSVFANTQLSSQALSHLTLSIISALHRLLQDNITEFTGEGELRCDDPG